MTTGHDVVAEARRWLGAPFRHQGRSRETGVDCLGLVLSVGRALGFDLADAPAYTRQPDAAALRAGLERHLLAVAPEAVRPGDILLMSIRRSPQHLGLLTEAGGIIHVHAAAGKVVEHDLGSRWGGLVVAAYRFPHLET